MRYVWQIVKGILATGLRWLGNVVDVFQESDTNTPHPLSLDFPHRYLRHLDQTLARTEVFHLSFAKVSVSSFFCKNLPLPQTLLKLSRLRRHKKKKKEQLKDKKLSQECVHGDLCHISSHRSALVEMKLNKSFGWISAQPRQRRYKALNSTRCQGMTEEMPA